MSLADRIAKLEARLAPLTAPALAAPVEVFEPEDIKRLPGARVFVRVFDGSRWVQPADEGVDAFRARVIVEAVRGGRLLPGQTAIRVCALRPRLTQNQWAAHNFPETPP